MSDRGNTAAAVSFLREFYPKGPWVLTCIDPGKKGIETATFTQGDTEALEQWLERWNGVRNIYFSEAEPIRPVSKKMERTDVRRVWYLHVDVDPRAGEDLEEEQARALALCTTNLPEGVPEPTFVVFSGGGYQAHWRLEEPIVVEGDLDKAEEAKLYNVQLERLFAADNCHNIDRIMRLPGTVNIPDDRKRKKGRTEVEARLVSSSGVVYPISRFTKAQVVQMPALGDGGRGSGPGAMQLEIPGNVPRLDSVEELDQWGVPDRVKVVVVQGEDPDNPKDGDNSRSAWLFDAVCNLVRCEVPDEVIYSVITDPDFLISASVLDKGSGTERYATRTILRAKERAIEPVLQEFNDRFAVIENWGGKCRVIEEIIDERFGRRATLTKQSFEEFRNRFLNRHVQVGVNDKGVPITKPAGKYWLEHPNRRQYHSITFHPGHESTDKYNLWKGFNVEAIPGDCGLYLDHVRDNICSGVEEHYEYLLNWMARTVQRPATAGQVAVVLRGGQGTGKGVFAKTFGHLFGRHFLPISNSSHLVGNFNAHLRDAAVVFADEAFFAGDKKHESVLKTLITEDSLAIEAKGVDVEVSPNFTHIIMASNSEWVVPAGADERRYFVLDVGSGHKQDAAYFKEIVRQLENGGYEALLHTLMNRDLSDFNVRDVPKTEALTRQKELSMSHEEEWWFRKLQEGAILDGHQGWETRIVKADLFQDFIKYSRDYNKLHRGNETIIGQFLNRICPGIYPRSRRLMARRLGVSEEGFQIEKRERVPHYVFPGLAECRAHWEKIFGPRRWEEIEEEEPELGGEIPF